MADHPMQPLELDSEDTFGRYHFKPNKIVVFLKNFAKNKGVGLSELADMPWSREDWDQFNQLIGYDLDGYHELSMVSDAAKEAADMAQNRLTKTHLPGCGTSARGCVEGCWNHDPHFDG